MNSLYKPKLHHPWNHSQPQLHSISIFHPEFGLLRTHQQQSSLTPSRKFVVMSSAVVGFVFLVSLIGCGWSGSVPLGEKREMPPSPYGGGGGGGYEAAGMVYSQPPPQGYGAQSYGGSGGGYPSPPPYSNPGFSVQTGFEGFLVPNSWYGLLPWGVEGVVIVIVGVIVFIVISAVLLGLLAWLVGFGDYAAVKESARSLLPTKINYAALADVTNSVLDALDKYDEINTKKD